MFYFVLFKRIKSYFTSSSAFRTVNPSFTEAVLTLSTIKTITSSVTMWTINFSASVTFSTTCHFITPSLKCPFFTIPILFYQYKHLKVLSFIFDIVLQILNFRFCIFNNMQYFTTRFFRFIKFIYLFYLFSSIFILVF